MKALLRKVLKKTLDKLRFVLMETVHRAENESLVFTHQRIISDLAFAGNLIDFKGKIRITDPRFVSIGSNVHIGDNAYIHSQGGLYIGDNVHISRNLVLYTTNHNWEGAIPYDDTSNTKPVIIGKNAWIGMNVCITPGVTIGEGAIIGLGSIISKDVPPFSIVGSQPFRIIKNRDKENYDDLIGDDRIGGNNGKLLEASQLRAIPERGVNQSSKIFFVLGTGRSGTQTLAKILNQHPNISCHHEKSRQLIRLAAQYLHKEVSEHEVRKELEFVFNEISVFDRNQYFGDSDQKLVALLPFIKEFLPDAKFIWMLRHPQKVIASTYARGWYSDKENEADSKFFMPYRYHIWENYRINGYKAGKFSKEVWERMDAFEKNCWYWSYWNQLIETELLAVKEENKILLYLEKLDSNQTKNICAFLGVEPIQLEVFRSNQAVTYKPLDWSSLTDTQLTAYEKYCGDSVRKWYPVSGASQILNK